MTEATKIKRKPGRKSNAEKAAILAAQEQARVRHDQDAPVLYEAPSDDHVEPSGRPDEVRAAGALGVKGVGDAEAPASEEAREAGEPEIGAASGSLGEPSLSEGDGSEQEVSRARGSLTQHERQGLINEALYVHEMQEATARYDSFNRRWAFRPTFINYVASLTIECKRGPDKREVSISNARFGAENVIEDVRAAIDLLDEAMA